MDEEEIETRYYAFSGQAAMLNHVETLLRFIERTGEQGVVRLFSAYVDGRNGGQVCVRILGSRIGKEEAGGDLPRLDDERAEPPHDVVDIALPRD